MQTTPHRSLLEGFYQAWVRRAWDEVQRFLTADFRFRSAVDDFTGIETHRTKCWPNGEGSRRLVVDQYMEQGDCAFLLYTWESDRGTPARAANGSAKFNHTGGYDFRHLHGNKV
jgi:SnoaL-like domain